MFIFVFKPINVDISDIPNKRMNSGFVLIELKGPKSIALTSLEVLATGNSIFHVFFKQPTIWVSETSTVLKKNGRLWQTFEMYNTTKSYHN